MVASIKRERVAVFVMWRISRVKVGMVVFLVVFCEFLCAEIIYVGFGIVFSDGFLECFVIFKKFNVI